MKFLYILTFTLFYNSNSFAQEFDLPPNAEPGKCYSICQTDSLIVKEEKVFRYTGSKEKARYIYSTSYYISPGYGMLLITEKMKSTLEDKIEIGNQKQIVLVKDTSKTDEYKAIKVFTFEYPESYGNWFEVVCKGDIDNKLVKNIQVKFKELGYYDGLLDGSFNDTLKKAIYKYQKDNDIHLIGDKISIKMLILLGIDYSH